jgi:hypothetical protein
MKIIVYTCTFPDYDTVYTPLVTTPGVDYVLYAPAAPRFLRRWQWRPLPAAVNGFSQTMANRYCKFFPDRLFPDADVTIYADGNILMKGDLRPLIDEFLATKAEMGLFPHPFRTRLDEEVPFCKKVGRIGPADFDRADAQLAGYYAEGLPRDHVLTQNGIILRRHDGPHLLDAMQLWWDQMQTHVPRDQLSSPYVIWKTGLAVTVWPWVYRNANPYFLCYGHRGSEAPLGYDLEMYAYIQKERPGLPGEVFRALHAVIKRLRGKGRSRKYPKATA